MPTGQGLGDKFNRNRMPFVSKGIDLTRPVNFLDPGFYLHLENLRAYRDGQLGVRPGLTKLSSGSPQIHSINRINDEPTNDYTYFVGSGTDLKFGKTTLAIAAGGYSGSPWTSIVSRPERSPSPLIYIADRNVYKKFDVLGNGFNWGIFPPVSPPVVTVQSAQMLSITDCTSTNPEVILENGNVWDSNGTAGVMTQTDRTATTIAFIRYDSGSIGYCNIQPTVMGTDIQVGQRIRVNGAEYIQVEQVFNPIGSTMIDSISYLDTIGLIGECVIQLSNPSDGLLPNCLVTLNGIETVRVLSVTTGPDQIPCFRCSTTTTHTPGELVVGVRSFRCYTAATYAIGQGLSTKAYSSLMTKGKGNLRHNIPQDLSMFASRPVRDDDIISFAVNLSLVDNLIEGRIWFDVDKDTTLAYSGTQEMRKNYYYYSFRKEDLQTIASEVQTQISGSSASIQNYQIDQFNQAPNTTFRDPQTGTVLSYDQLLQAKQEITRSDISPFQRFSNVKRRLVERYDEQLGQGNGLGISTANVGDPGPFQAGSGNEQWLQLNIRVGELIRIGSDKSRNLKDCKSMMINFNLSDTTTCKISSVAIIGGFNSDMKTSRDLGNAYYYRTVGRNELTGEISLPSPPTRAGVISRRQQQIITSSLHPDSQVTKLDFYRYGGTIFQWIYVGSADNTGMPTLTDNLSDGSIANNPALQFDKFPPFPTADIPKSGTLTVVGTRVTITSGGLLNVNYSPGTEIIINGKAFLFYAQPESSTVVELTESAGSIIGAQFEIPNPIIMGQKLPTVIGPYGGGFSGLYNFAVGDDFNPGVLYWTNGNDTNSASDANYLEVTTPSEPLIGGCIYDGRPYIWSSERMFMISPNPSATIGTSIFVAQEVANSKGAWTANSIVVDTLIYFVGKDGIYESEGGQPRSITDETLYPLFPHDGQPGQGTSLIPPPDYTQPNTFQLVSDGQFIRFIYQAFGGGIHMLLWEKANRRWWFDRYGDGGITTLYADKGQTLYRMVAGTGNGNFCTYLGTTDNGANIATRVQTMAFDTGDPRSNKRWGDIFLDIQTGIVNPATVIVYANNYFASVLTSSVTSFIRGARVLDLQSGDELFAVNLALDISHPGDPTASFQLYEWEPSYVAKPESTQLRATDWDNGGDIKAKFLQGVIIEADTSGVTRTVQIQGDDGVVLETLSINHLRQHAHAYWLNTPATIHTVRLKPTDTDDPDLDGNPDSWRIYNCEWIWEPAPELASVWQTQGTTNDTCGWQHAREAYITVISTSDVTLTVNIDGTTYPYTIPNTSGNQRKIYLPFQSIKGKVFTYRLESPAATPFQLFAKDSCVIIGPWGRSESYQATHPFGGDSRRIGAII